MTRNSTDTDTETVVSPAPPDSESAKGSPEVQQFYEDIGWEYDSTGKSYDQQLFGSRTNAQLQDSAYWLRVTRIRAALASACAHECVLECGGGGNPAAFIDDLFRHHTMVDFSSAGLSAGRKLLLGSKNAVHAVQGDMCNLPLAPNSMDAAYSANAIYHIPQADGQRNAFKSIMNTVKPGGVGVFVLANSRPLAFPGRLLARLIADVRPLARIANRFRHRPPLPYKPMSKRWMRACLKEFGAVEITGHAMASTWFQQYIPERGLGRLAWRLVLWIEREHPRVTAHLGTYVTIVVRRPQSG